MTELIYRPPTFWYEHRFSFLEEQWTLGVKFAQCNAILNDSWVVNLRDVPKPPSYSDRIQSICGNLKDDQREYNMRKYNMINKEPKLMFNTEEVEFIAETAKKDLLSINAKIESMVNDLARVGKNLSDIKVVKSKLESIISAIEESKSNTTRITSRCC